jgi:peptide chain release factor 2
MKVLRSRLYDLREREQQAKLDEIGGEKRANAFGSQIRNYVLHPYQMVKDLRTQVETGNVERVLDGDFDPFIKAYLLRKAASASPAG